VTQPGDLPGSWYGRTALGAIAFAEPIDIWGRSCGAVILGPVTFITWRESDAERQNHTRRTGTEILSAAPAAWM